MINCSPAKFETLHRIWMSFSEFLNRQCEKHFLDFRIFILEVEIWPIYNGHGNSTTSPTKGFQWKIGSMTKVPIMQQV